MKIRWIKLKPGKSDNRASPRIEALEAYDRESINYRLRSYKRLLTKDPRAVVSDIFDGEEDWVENVMASVT